MISKSNLFTGSVPKENHEVFSTLAQFGNVRIESIRSWLKEPGQWYDQDQDEWVLLVEGEAKLEIAGESLSLYRGDYLFIPKHTPHRVLSTSKNALWLGVFY